MADIFDKLHELGLYKGSWEYSVSSEYLGGGKYKYYCTTKYYEGDNLVKTEVNELITVDKLPPDPGTTDVIGVIQENYPLLYNTVTQLSQITKEDGKPFVTGMGLERCCANCTALTSVNVKNDIVDYDNVSLYRVNTRAFYNCVSLITVDLGDTFETMGHSYADYMFEGCTNLTTVIGKIIIPRSYLLSYHGMFKDCSNVTGLQLIDPDNCLLTDPEIEGFDGVGYEYLGLTSTSQFEVVS